MDRQQDIAEKATVEHDEPIMKETAHAAAERGHVATDKYGQALVTFDKKEEARLRLKIDLYVVPTVFLLYLFAFIDRSNIGKVAQDLITGVIC